MSYNSRNYRHRNPKTGGEEQKTGTPFFNAPREASPKSGVQRKKKGDVFFQPKLKIGQPGDVQEKEADATAGQVVRRLATSKEDEKLGTQDARMEKDKEDPEKPVYTKAMPDEKKKDKSIRKADDPEKKKKKGPGMGQAGGMIHKKENDAAAGNFASPEVSAEIMRQSGKGSPMPARTLAEMSRSFGIDLSHVRIHTDAAAVRLCQVLNAQAFTHGCDIYFNEGKYDPESSDGRLLLAHELTHVAQQHEE